VPATLAAAADTVIKVTRRVARSGLAQKPGQLGDTGGDAPGLVADVRTFRQSLPVRMAKKL
jgi:hypothetical protein